MRGKYLREWLLPLGGAVWFAAYAAVILLHRRPPLLGDFPDWVYQGALLARHLRGLPDAAHTLKAYPVPNSTLTVALGLSMLLLPWAVAAKAVLCGVLAAAWVGIRRMERACRTGGWIWCVAPGAFFLNVNFWFGLLAFQLGLALLFLFVAEVLERCRPSVLALLLLVLFFTHMMPFAFACLVLLAAALWLRQPRVLVAALPAMLLLVWYVAGRFAGGDPDATVAPALPVGGGFGWMLLFKANTVVKSMGLVNPGTAAHRSVALAVLGQPVYVLVLAVNAVVCVAAVAAAARAALHWWRERGTSIAGRNAVWTAILVCLPVYLLLPREALGVSDPGSRVLQMALYLGLFLVGTRLRSAISAGSVVLATVGLLLFVRVGFSVPEEPRPGRLPAAANALALSPYAIREYLYVSLDAGDTRHGVFPTGLFVSRR